jgi:hypothetical protein
MRPRALFYYVKTTPKNECTTSSAFFKGRKPPAQPLKRKSNQIKQSTSKASLALSLSPRAIKEQRASIKIVFWVLFFFSGMTMGFVPSL